MPNIPDGIPKDPFDALKAQIGTAQPAEAITNKKQLAEYEKPVRAWAGHVNAEMTTRAEAGARLTRIREEHLYTLWGYSRFSDYVLAELKVTMPRVSQAMTDTVVIKAVSKHTDLNISSEKVSRELGWLVKNFEDGAQTAAAILEHLNEKHNGRVTAADVKAEVALLKPPRKSRAGEGAASNEAQRILAKVKGLPPATPDSRDDYESAAELLRKAAQIMQDLADAADYEEVEEEEVA